ncbi:MAG: PAS domain-containing protein, partial [Chitinivibrionales bacterium]|nr:PAS domain-containing protein [Chitinivibrionales bacterium]
SESLGDFSGYFSVLDSKNKMYRKREMSVIHGGYQKLSSRLPEPIPVRRRESGQEVIRGLGARVIAEKFGPASVLVSEKLELLQIYGDINPYLVLASGTASLNVLQMCRAGLRHKLGATLTLALKSDVPVQGEGIQIKNGGNVRIVDITVLRLPDDEQPQRLLLVVFRERQADGSPTSKSKKKSESLPDDTQRQLTFLEQELNATREYLQTIIEELQTANEDLRSTNEEMQSTNEELETSREELQSTNEELITVNSELQNKVEELSQAGNDINNLLAGNEIATIFLDVGLRVKRYTPASVKIFRLLHGDIGRPIRDITSKIIAFDINQAATEVLATLVRKDIDVQIEGEGWFSIRILPYRTADNTIEGVVLTFVDTTALVRALHASQKTQLLAENIVESIRQPFVVLDDRLLVIAANMLFYEMFRVKPDQTLGKQLFELGNGQWNVPEIQHALERVIPKDMVITDYRIEHDFPLIGRRTMILNGRRIAQLNYIILEIQDVTGMAAV